MLTRHWFFPKLCVTVALILFTTPLLAVAAHSGDGPQPWYTGGRLAPIGKLYSLGAVLIDGRTLSGEQSLWGGEQVWAREASASVHLDGVGQVLLYKGSIAKLATSLPTRGAMETESVLSVMVSTGEVAVSLEPGSVARIAIGDTVFKASRGAKFRIHTADDERAFEVKTGVITREALPQHPKYDVGPVTTNNIGRDIGKASGKKQVRRKERDRVAVKLQELEPPKAPTKAAFQTDSLQQPAKGVVGVKVRFCLEKPIGVFLPSRSLCETVETNQYGVAIVDFEAGPNTGTSPVKAQVLPPSQGSWTGEIEVVKGPVFGRNVIILAAAIGGVICAVKCRPHSRPPLQQVPPPNVP